MMVGTYRISEMKMAIIRNVFPSPMVNNVENCKLKIENSRIILWAGRMLYLKNLARLIHAFVKANDGSYELYLIGDGPEKKNYSLPRTHKAFFQRPLDYKLSLEFPEC